MLDMELIRKDREAVATALAKRLDPAEVNRALDEIQRLDQERRALITEIDAERQRRKAEARAYAEAKRSGVTPEPVAESERKQLAELESQLDEVQSRLRTTMSELPNLPADDVVAGGKEANRVVRTFGEPPAVALLACDLEQLGAQSGVRNRRRRHRRRRARVHVASSATAAARSG